MIPIKENTMDNTREFRFKASYEMDSPAGSIRIARSWITNGTSDLSQLEKWCNDNGANYAQVENFLTALSWGGKFEYEQQFSSLPR